MWLPKGPQSIERENFSTLYAEFRYLLTLNEVFLQHFLLIFITKEADFVHEIKNNTIVDLFFNFKGMPWPSGIP